jgi:alpha,alpha-trehalase
MALELSTNKQSAYIKSYLEKNFLQQGGLLATKVYSDEQWDAPNGWAPLQWMTYKGMMNYDFHGFAETIRELWTNNVERVFKETGKLTEKYNVVDISAGGAGGGEYPNQDGFGWTNGVYQKFKSL